MYTSSSIENVSGKVMRRVRTFSRRGVCIGSKLIPLRYHDKDWSGIPAGPGVTALVSVNRGKRDARGMIDSYLRGATLPPVVGDAITKPVRPTAKRDWLIAMGAITPDGSLTERELEWVPGDRVYAEHDRETEEEWDAVSESTYIVPLRREVECADDCTEDESLVIEGGYFKVKGE